MKTTLQPSRMKIIRPTVPVILAALLLLSTAWMRAESGEAMAPAGGAGLVDCDNRGTIARALQRARLGDTILVKGTCREAVRLTQDGLTLIGLDGAVIDGGGHPAVTIDGAQRVTLQGFTVTNGTIGIVGQGGAHFTLRDIIAANNQQHGIDVENGSGVIITGTFESHHHPVFGILLGGNSVATFTQATVTLHDNTLGMQVGIASSATLADSHTTLTAYNNLTDGLTVVTGSHLFSFGGTITTRDNGFNGISAFSKSGIDLDAGTQLNTSANGQAGIQLGDSSLTLFNIPQFTGASNKSTVNAHDNHKGIELTAAAVISMATESQLLIQQNTQAGLHVDEASIVTIINSTITNNNMADLILSFGSRADLGTTNTIGMITCDGSSLIRPGPACPHL